jgi:hypothetical protein
MNEDTTFNLGRELAEILLGVMLQIALHLGMPEVAALRLRARLEVMVDLWGAMYLAWLARRDAAPPSRIRRYARATARRPMPRSVPRSVAALTRARPTPALRVAAPALPAAIVRHPPEFRLPHILPRAQGTPIGPPPHLRALAFAGPPQKIVFASFVFVRP